MDQMFYLKNLEELDQSASFSDYRSIQIEIEWSRNTLPDMQFEISKLAEVTEKLTISTPRCIFES